MKQLLTSLLLFSLISACISDDSPCGDIEDNVITSEKRNFIYAVDSYQLQIDSAIYSYKLNVLKERSYMIDFYDDWGCEGMAEVKVRAYSDEDEGIKVVYKWYLQNPDDDYPYSERLDVIISISELNIENDLILRFNSRSRYQNSDTIKVHAPELDNNYRAALYSRDGLIKLEIDENISLIALP
ncbi:MAG: hypothetical protein ACPGLV_08120 [Bacteroidia bacterium]